MTNARSDSDPASIAWTEDKTPETTAQAWLSESPEYDTETYKLLSDYKRIYVNIIIGSSIFLLFPAIYSVLLIGDILDKGLSYLSILSAIRTIVSFTGLIYVIRSARYYNVRYYRTIILISIIPLFSMRFLDIILLFYSSFVLVKWSNRKEIEDELKLRGILITDPDFYSILDNVILPLFQTKPPVVLSIAPHSRIFQLENYLLRRILKNKKSDDELSQLQNDAFRSSISEFFKLKTYVLSLTILLIFWLFPNILAILLIGTPSYTAMSVLVILSGIALWIRFRHQECYSVKAINQAKQLTTYLLVSYLLPLLSLGFVYYSTDRNSPFLYAVIGMIFQSLCHFLSLLKIRHWIKTNNLGVRAFESFNVPYQKDYIDALKTMHCILSSYKQRFITSEESGWDDSDSDDKYPHPESKPGSKDDSTQKWEFQSSQQATEE